MATTPQLTRAEQVLERVQTRLESAIENFKAASERFANAIDQYRIAQAAYAGTQNPSRTLRRNRERALQAHNQAQKCFNAALDAVEVARSRVTKAQQWLDSLKEQTDQQIAARSNAARTTPMFRPQPRANGPAPAGRIRSMLGL